MDARTLVKRGPIRASRGGAVATLGGLALAMAGACVNGGGGGTQGISLPTGANEPGGSTNEPGGSTYQAPGGGQEPGATPPEPGGGGTDPSGAEACLACVDYVCSYGAQGFNGTGSLSLVSQAGVDGCVVPSSPVEILCNGTILDAVGEDGGGGALEVVGTWSRSGQGGLTLTSASGIQGVPVGFTATCVPGELASSGSSSNGSSSGGSTPIGEFDSGTNFEFDAGP